MVNYIPAIQFDAEMLYCLTIAGDKNNEKWDENLKRQLENKDKSIYEKIEFERDCLFDIEELKNKIKGKLDDKNIENIPIFWNVTGGQRYFLMAIYDIFKARENDNLCYFEGNTNEIVILENIEKRIEKRKNHEKGSPIFKAKCDDIEIKDALNLMGFKGVEFKTKKPSIDYKVKFSKDGTQSEGIFKESIHLFLEFNNIFSKEESLREFCFNTKGEPIIKVIDILSDEKKNKTIKQVLENKNFGKIFELMCATKIHETIIKSRLPVTEMIISQKIAYDEKENSNIDEFDIILATSSGKVLIFECKTGNMAGDVAKSTKFSTYAVGGVYGMPILFVPLLKDENINIPEFAKNLKWTKASAERANLECWAFDEIEEKLKKNIK